MERDALSPEPMVYSFICISQSPQLKELSHEMGKMYRHCAQSPTQTKGSLVPQRIVYDTAITTPVPCSLQHDTFHFGLGRPEPH
jgi:hypothetical protein